MAAEAAIGGQGALEIDEPAGLEPAEVCAAERFLEQVEFQPAVDGRGGDREAAAVDGDAFAFAALGRNGVGAQDEAGGALAAVKGSTAPVASTSPVNMGG